MNPDKAEQDQDLRAGIQFESDANEEKVTSEDLILQSSMSFDADKEVNLIELSEELNEEPEITGRIKTRTKIKWGFIGVSLVVILATVELILGLVQSWQTSPILASAWLVAIGALITSTVPLIVREFEGLARLKRYSVLLDENQISCMSQIEAIQLCEKTSKAFPIEITTELMQWREAMSPELTGSEVVTLFSKMVLSPIDKRALNTITFHAAATGSMVSLSSLAFVDSILVLWRQFKMLGQITRFYGYGNSYFARLALIKEIFRQSLVAGASELVMELGSFTIGTNIISNISARIAQGVGIGVMTAKLGVRMMSTCRPISFDDENKPSIDTVTKSVIEQIKTVNDKS